MAGFGGSVKLTGESEYQKALRGITENLKVLSSEMKVVTSQYDKNDKSTQNLSSQNEVLNKKISEQQQKVNLLTQALASAKSETGENSTTTKKWQVELNNAQSELNALKKKVDDNKTAMEQSEDATDDNTKSLKKFGDEAESSGQSAFKLGDIIKANLLSDAIKSGLSALASGMKQLGSTLVGIGKDAIASYADYEQLIGGVETLFGAGGKSIEEYAESVGKPVEKVQEEYDKLMKAQNNVIENSNNAYKTAGLSANEYMETVTSFTARLVQTLGGDTVKASEYAHQAIVDMADNANKMGSDMASIQNAYQGFAKQNYSMLDNLKLGYGGTQKEMFRLMSDAAELDKTFAKNADFSLNNKGQLEADYQDIIDAIHIIQTNMGITGTTALEASTTISGSANAMKSAWQNLLTGIADDNADFGQLINNLLTSLVGGEEGGGFLNNILPRIEIALDGVMQFLIASAETLLPKLMEVGMGLVTNLISGISNGLPQLLESASTALTTFINGITTVLPELVPIAFEIIKTVIDSLIENLPQILEMGITILVELIEGIADTIPELIPTVVEAVITIVETLLDNIDMLIDASIKLILALADGLIDAVPILIEKAPIIIEKLFNAFIENYPKIVQAGGELLGKLAVGITTAIPTLIRNIPIIIDNIINGIKNGYETVKSAGGYLIEGMWEGIKSKWEGLKDACANLGNAVINKFKDVFGIASPSKVFKKEIGTNLALGIGAGFEGTMDKVNKQMAGAIQTDYDLNVGANLSTGTTSSSGSYLNMVNAFKQALKEVKVVMDDREMGTFVTDTMERVVYA